jgi:phage-related minor tail protein
VADLSMVFDLLARDRASSEVGKVGDSMRKAGDEADGFGDRMSGMFAGIAGVAAGAGLAVGAAFAGALETQGANRTLTAQLGLNPEESAAAGRIAGDLFASNYGDSMEQASAAVGDVISSIEGMRGASDEAVQGATRNVLNFASAFEVDTAEAAQMAGSLIRNGLAADATEAFDLMTAGFQQVPAAMREELPAILGEYGTNFRALGYSGEQAMALLVDAAAQGPIVLDKMGDALKEFTIRGTDMSTASVAAYGAIGLSAEDMAGKLAAGGPAAQEATQQVAAGLLGIEDPVQRANSAIALFGTPLEDMSVDQIPAFLQAISGANGELEGVAGTAANLDSTLSTGVGPTLETMKRGLQTAATEGMGALMAGFTQGKTDADGWQGGLQNAAATVSGVLTPALSGLGDFLTTTVGPALSTVFGYLSEHQGTVTTIAAVIGAVLLPILVTWGIVAAATAASNVLAWFTTAAAGTAGAAAAELSSLQVVAGWVIMGVQSMLQAARMAAAWFIALGPVGWVIALVVGLIALIIANWDTVVAATKAAWQWVSDAVGGAWDWVVDKVTGAAAAVWGLISGAWDTVKTKTSEAWEAVKTAVSAGIDAVVTFVTGLPGKAVNALSSLGSSIAGVATTAWQWFNDNVGSKIREFESFVGGIPGKAVAALGNMGSTLYNKGKDLINGLIDGAKSILKNIGRFFLDVVPDWIRGPFESALGISSPSKVFAGYGVNIGQGLLNGLGAMRPAIADELAHLADTQATDLLASVGVTGGGGGLGYRAPGYDTAGPAAAAGATTTINTTINAAPTIPTEDQLAGVYRRASLLQPRRS